MSEVTYEVCVTPLGFDGLIPMYEVMIYAMRRAGICGPFTEAVTVRGLEGMHGKLDEWGFTITGEFSPVCRNGFASAPVALRTRERVNAMEAARKGTTT